MDCRTAAHTAFKCGTATFRVVGALLVLVLGAKGARADEQPAPQVTVTDVAPVQPEEDDNGILRRTHEPLFVGLDFLLGFGNYTAVDTQLPSGTVPSVSYVFGTSQIRTETFMLLGHYRFKKFGIGARLPIVVAHIANTDTGLQGTDVFNNGNLELSADMPHRMSPQIRYIPQIALTIPISSGSTPPYTQDGLTAQNASQSLADQYARYAAGLAAAFARGGEDDALFFNWRLGITPKLTFDMKFNHTMVEPYVKIPIMFSMEQNPSSEEVLRLELVGGVRVAQQVGPVQVGLRVTGMIPIAARTSLKTPMLAVWPEVRLQLTQSAQFWLSGMIPLAGDYNVFNDGKNGAFQAGLAATF